MTEFERKEVGLLIERALNEDLGDGDHTSMATIPKEANGKVKMIAKEGGIVAGVEVASMVFHQVDEGLVIDVRVDDGDKISKGDVLMTVSGSSRSILSAERTALNFIQRMSGIATFTNSLTEMISDLNTKLLDTRKTTPGNRIVEKLAVRYGGGTNHRFGLFDMVMIKDNHIDFAGRIKNAIESTKNYLKKHKKDLRIEIEVRNFDELGEVLNEGGIDRIMLDNFTPEELSKAIIMINGKYETEASGGINAATIRDYALTGVDYISVGALTHQIRSLDISLITTL